ncbi:hypothetical protein Tco_0429954, partial [Tanacetum coccineum]
MEDVVVKFTTIFDESFIFVTHSLFPVRISKGMEMRLKDRRGDDGGGGGKVFGGGVFGGTIMVSGNGFGNKVAGFVCGVACGVVYGMVCDGV